MKYSIDGQTRFKLNVLLDRSLKAEIIPEKQFIGLGLLETRGLITEDLKLTELGEKAYMRKAKERLAVFHAKKGNVRNK